jgi:hypothetical protein
MNKKEIKERLQEAGIGIDEHVLPWHRRLLLRFWPRMAMRIFSREIDADYSVLESINGALQGIEHVDIFPFSPREGGHRGFMLVLDRKMALYFYQDGESFRYDGYEMGEYDKGDVSVFDDMKIGN